jgi:hypothetical protein
VGGREESGRVRWLLDLGQGDRGGAVRVGGEAREETLRERGSEMDMRGMCKRAIGIDGQNPRTKRWRRALRVCVGRAGRQENAWQDRGMPGKQD